MKVFDIESNGLLDTVTVIHCINVYDRAKQQKLRFNDAGTGNGTIEQGLRLLEEPGDIAGHNVHEYDVPAIQKVYPWFHPRGRVVDSRAHCRLIWPLIEDADWKAVRGKRLPEEFVKAGLVGQHSLKAWGYRTGSFKGDFDPANYINEKTGEPHTWATIPFSQDMDDYCMLDVMSNVALFELIESKGYDERALYLENDVARIIAAQQMNGFAFDVKAAEKLYAKIQGRRIELEAQLKVAFPPWQAVKKDFIPKVNNKARGYVKGERTVVYKTVEFNPASRDHIADRLTATFGWEPREFTDGGKPKVDETTLEALPYPEAKLLNEYLMIEKRLGQIGDGNQAWIKSAKDGRIYGRVNSNGAITGRMTHYKPNIAQTPKADADVPYGKECRALWTHSLGKLVGCDAEGLELRMLAHYMARYDDGAYAKTVIEGQKSNGTDVHSVNRDAIGLRTRDNAKTWVYAYLYGAGDYKLGTIVISDFDDEKLARFNKQYAGGRLRDGMITNLGARSRARFVTKIPALGKLAEAVQAAGKTLRSLDGRILPVRHKHAALNTLLQGAGAVVMKQALSLLDGFLASQSLREGIDFQFVANVHDEFQIDSKEQHAEVIGRAAAQAITNAGAVLGLRVALSGSYSVGDNWAGTH
jgi:DNA polymerase I